MKGKIRDILSVLLIVAVGFVMTLIRVAFIATGFTLMSSIMGISMIGLGAVGFDFWLKLTVLCLLALSLFTTNDPKKAVSLDKYTNTTIIMILTVVNSISSFLLNFIYLMLSYMILV